MKLKRKLLVIIMINILPLQNLISSHQKIFATRLKQENLASYRYSLVSFLIELLE